MIELNNIIKRFKKIGKKRLLVFNNISKSFPDRGMVFIVGEEKSGKTTFLNLLAGLDKLSFGNIYIDNRILSFDEMDDIYKYRLNQVSYIFSENNMKKFEMVRTALKKVLKRKHELEGNDDSLLKILKGLQIEHLKNKLQIQLTKRESQKVGLALSIAKDTPIILVDEPSYELLDILKGLSLSKLVIVTSKDELLAKSYGNRIIYIENGKMDRDLMLSSNSVYEPNERSVPKVKTNQLKSLNLIQIIKKMTLTLVLLISFAFVLYIASIDKVMNAFDTFDTLIQTTESNESYVLPIYKYQERAFTYGWTFIIRAGTFNHPEDVRESYREVIDEKTNQRLPLYASYFFNKNFQDFFDVEFAEIGIDDIKQFRSLHFTEAILVDDFSKFNEPLLMGVYPLGASEILIYDYMAEQIVTSGIDGLKDISDLLNYELIDKDTNFMMKISGILRSQYGDYRYIEGQSQSKIMSEKTYLQSLQSIYANPDFLSQIKSEGLTFSIHEVKIQDYLDRNIESDLEFRKVGYIDDIQDYTWIGDHYPYNNGIYISKHQLAELLDVDPSLIDSDYVNDLALYTRYTFEISSFYYDYSWNKSNTNKIYIKILGVYDSDTLDKNTLYTHLDIKSRYPNNGSLRRFYLGLDTNWDLNKEVLEAFKVPDSKSFIFFYENLEYSTDDFGIYSAHRLMTEETKLMVYEIQNDYLIYTVLSVLVMIITTFIFVYMVMPYNQMNIYIERMRGRRNLALGIKFFIEMSLLAVVVSFIVYYPTLLSIQNIEETLLNIKPYLYLNLYMEPTYLLKVFLWVYPILILLTVIQYSIRLTQYPLSEN